MGPYSFFSGKSSRSLFFFFSCFFFLNRFSRLPLSSLSLRQIVVVVLVFVLIFVLVLVFIDKDGMYRVRQRRHLLQRVCLHRTFLFGPAFLWIYRVQYP